MKQLFILFFCLVFSSNTFAQSASQAKDLRVYPVRVNHKWGYAKFYGTFVDTLIAPRYDYIGDIHLPWNIASEKSKPSPYRLFEIENKVGLLDNYLSEFIPNKYKRIRPISEQFFAVETGQGFQLINQKGDFLFEGTKYDDIKGDRADDKLRFFLVKKDQKWAIKNKAGDVLVDYKYAAIQNAGASGFFKVKSSLDEKSWMLIDSIGNKILADRYVNVRVLDEKVIAIRKDGSFAWKYFLRSNKVPNAPFLMQAGEFKSIKKVSNHMLALVPYDGVVSKNIILQSLKGDYEIINTIEVKTIGTKDSKKIVPDFHYLDGNYAAQSVMSEDKRKVKYQVIDSLGGVRSAPYDSIYQTSKKNVFFVSRDYELGFASSTRWGVLQPKQGVVLKPKTIFSRIFDFEDGIAITVVGDNYGALAFQEEETDRLPPLFETVFKSGKNTLQVQTSEGKAVIYKLTAEGKFEEDLIVSNTFVFSENAKRKIVEAENRRLVEIKREKDTTPQSLWGLLNYSYTNEKLTILNDGEFVLQTELQDAISGIEEIHLRRLAIYYKNKTINNKVTKVFAEEPLEQIAFFDTEQNKVASESPMIGFRDFDKNYDYTAFMDAEGKMGLIDKNGQQLKVNGKPLRYLYIGTFQGGRARVCIGDRLIVDKKGKLEIPSRYTIGTVDELISEFNMEVAGKESYGEKNEFAVYTWKNEGSCAWGYIDKRGKLLLKTDYDYLEDFNPKNNRALAFRTLDKGSGLKPRAGFGLIDKVGNEVLKSEHDLLNIEYKNLKDTADCFQITVGQTPTFYFNQKGHQVFVNPTRMRPFSEGLALFRDTKDKWGFVDSTGNILIEPRYQYARPFSDGLALVIDDTGYCSFIDKKGAVVFTSSFTKKQQIGVGDFHNGRCWFKGTKGWFWGCFDKKGNEVIEPKYYYQIKGISLPKAAEPYFLPMDFINGSAASVQILNEAGKPTATMIDPLGKTLIQPDIYATIGAVDEHGIASYTLPSGKAKGLLNTNGEILCKTQYLSIGSFQNGFAKVKSKNNTWGLIDMKGKVVLKPIYEEVGLASEGLVAVKTQNSQGWYFVNMTGKKTISGPFKSVTPFQGGMSFVNYKKEELLIDKTGNRIPITTGKPLFFSEGILGILKNPEAIKRRRIYFYADESGNNILGRDFAEITPFQLGVSKVRRVMQEVPGAKKRRELLGAINKRGVMVVPPKFRNLHLQPDGNIVINPQRFYGLVTVDGKKLLDPIYDLITYYREDSIIRVEQGEKVGYAELKNDELTWIWEMGN